MEYLRQFADATAYNTAKSGGLLSNPCVSLIKVGMTVQYDPYVEPYDPAKDMVDLGLPSGTLWAKANLGATNETTKESWYGDYYAWGELEPKENYAWDTYRFGTENNLTKYNPTDGLNTLQPEDDVVTATYGAGYRMPTKAEIEALYALPNEWVTDYNNISGLNGRVFTGNGNTLFIPAAGYYDGSSHYGAGSYCYLWSSSLYTDSPEYARYLNFVSYDINANYGSRCGGQSVRAIKSKS